MRELFDRVRNLYGYATAYNSDPHLKHLQALRDHNLAEFDRMIAHVEAAAEQRGAYRAACQAFRHAATAFDYPEAGDQYCTWEDVAKWLRANADKHDPEHRADRMEGDDV